MRQLALLIILFLCFTTHAQTINFNEVVVSEISTLGEIDVFTFTGSSGDLIRITAACGDNPTNTAFDPELELVFPDGSTEGPVYNINCSDVNLDVSLSQSGSYQIRVTDWSDNDTGNYNLYLEIINPAFEAVPLEYGDVIQGSLDNNGDIDLYTFMGTSGDQIRAAMACNSVISNTAFDPELQLVAPDGSIYNPEYNINCSDVNYDFTLSQSGTYTIIATDWNGNDFGEYNLFLEKLNSSVNSKPINYGEFVADTLDIWGDIDLFTFSGSSGELVRVNMACQSDIVDTAFDPEIQVLAPDGSIYQPDYNINCSDINYDIELVQSGAYTIIATDWSGNNAGKYNLHLDRLLPAQGATAISFGTPIIRDIARNGEFDLYTFSGNVGDLVNVKINCTSGTTDTAFDPEAQIIAPDGSIFSAGNSNNCNELEYLVELSQSGTHTLIASDWSGNNFGEYEISINIQVNPSFTSDATTIDQGQSIQFNDNSTGDPTSWEWIFEGGTPSTSTQQNPLVTYDTPGVYDVTLTVGNGTSSETITEADYVTVISTSLEADFTASSTSTFAGGQIDFTDISTGDPISWNWTFEGGTPNSSSEQNPSVIYEAQGVYDVSLTVSDGTEENTTTRTDFITITTSENVLELASTIDDFDFTTADIQGNYIYALDDGFNADVFKVYDVSNPSNPLEVYSLEFSFELDPNSIIADGDRLIIGGEGGDDASLVIMDISDPANPVLIASHLTIPRNDGQPAREVTGLRNIKGDILYTQSGIWNLMSINISNPAAPVIIDGFGDDFTGLIIGVVGSFVIQDDNNAWLDNDDFRHASIDQNGGITMNSKQNVTGELYDFDITNQNNIGYAATWQSNAANVVTIDFSNQIIDEVYIQDIDSLVGGFGFSARMELYEAKNLLFVSSVVDFLTLDITNRNQPVPLEVNEGAGILERDGDILITGGFASSLHIYSILGGTVEEVEASFISDQTSILEGESVQFTDNSTGNPSSWSWTFEGGTPTTSAAQNPVVSYATAGVYDVSLAVSNGADSDEILLTDYIEVIVNPLPDLVIASASSDPTSDFAGSSINTSTIIVNTGDADILGQVSVDYYLSSDNQLDGSDTSLGTSSIADLAVSSSKTLDFNVMIPETTEPGDYFIIFELDSENLVQESNEDNNTSVATFEVLDRAPFISNPISDLDLEQGFTTELIDITNVFEDPDQDALSFTVSSDNTAVVTAAVSGFSVTLTEQGAGIAMISVTANDNEDGSVTDEFLVSINATGNNKPIVENAIEDLALFVGFGVETVDIGNVFSDADGDNLELTLTGVSGNSVAVSLDGTTITLAEQDEGITSISLQAYDGNGGLVSTEFSVEVISNASPTVENPIADVMVTEGFVTETISLVNVFADAEGDDLTYSAVSDDETVVTVSISNTNLIVVEQGIGEATITVTADDGNGGTASDDFIFTVNDINEAPVVENPIPDVAYEPGFGTAAIELDTVFFDPDGDELMFTVTTANDTVVTASISGSSIILTEIGNGMTDVTVTADDGRGESVQDTFSVLNQGNTPPVIENPIEDQILSQGFVTSSLNFEGVFSDPDDDVLTYAVTSLDEDIITVSISGTNVVFIEQSLGDVLIALSANDGREGIVTDTFNVSIVENTLPELNSPIEDQILEEGFGTVSFSLANVFSDADGDDLTYSATSSNEEVVTTSTSSTSLVLLEEGLGEATIVLNADDGKGGIADNTFTVEIVEGALGVEGAADFVYPTITNGVIHISSEKLIKEVRIHNLNGSLLRTYDGSKQLDVGSIADGVYLLTVGYMDGSSGKMKIIIKH